MKSVLKKEVLSKIHEISKLKKARKQFLFLFTDEETKAQIQQVVFLSDKVS